MKFKSQRQIEQHIENLQELKEDYAAKGDTLNVKIITNMINDQERLLDCYKEQVSK